MNYFNFNIHEKPKKGDLLISEPFLPDPNFERTVVLLCEHNEDGSFGFVLNKPSLLKLNDVMEDVTLEQILYVGGPVQQDTLHFVHRAGSLLEGSMEVNNGIFWGGNYEQLQIMLQNGQLDLNDFKFLVGYSGWGSGQLEKELEEKSWIVSNAAIPKQVFDMEPDRLWKAILSEMGGKFRMMANYPIDPRMN